VRDDFTGRISEQAGRLPIDTHAQAFYKAETREFGPDWQPRFQVHVLFPR
jgi:hypothetical protein